MGSSVGDEEGEAFLTQSYTEYTLHWGTPAILCTQSSSNEIFYFYFLLHLIIYLVSRQLAGVGSNFPLCGWKSGMNSGWPAWGQVPFYPLSQLVNASGFYPRHYHSGSFQPHWPLPRAQSPDQECTAWQLFWRWIDCKTFHSHLCFQNVSPQFLCFKTKQLCFYYMDARIY